MAQHFLVLQTNTAVVARADVAEVVGVGFQSWIILVIDILGALATRPTGRAGQAERTYFRTWIVSPLGVLLLSHASRAVAVSPLERGRNERKKD